VAREDLLGIVGGGAEAQLDPLVDNPGQTPRKDGAIRP
jgi:hypothetical protein